MLTISRRWMWPAAAAFATLAIGLSGPAAAQTKDTLTIGYIGGNTTMDPHFHIWSVHSSVQRPIFDGIVNADANMNPIPGLAESWKLIDDKTWEFTLRNNVVFSDGTPFSIDDIIFSFERARAVKDSPSGGYIRPLRGKTVQKVSDTVFRIVTEQPQPNLLVDLSSFGIVSRKHATGATREDFNSGKATIGTGPYKFVEWVPGNRVVFERNERYWGEKPPFHRVVMRPIESGPTRVAALVSGDVDVIDQVPTSDLANLGKMAGIHIAQAPSKRIMYIHFDTFREKSPFVKAKNGGEIANPLRDKRVRQALSLAISRQDIAEFVMEKGALPAAQFAPKGAEGVSPNLVPPKQDLAKARALLKEAGVPDGFQVTFHTTGQTYPGDVQTAEAIGQMWSQIGVQTSVVSMPGAVFFRRGTSGGPDGTPEFSVMMAGCCGSTGGAITPLLALMGTPDPKSGSGSANRGRYSNPKLDELLAQGRTEMDDAKREAVIRRAAELVAEEVPVIAVHFIQNIWATRGNVRWEPTLEDTTIPMQARLVK